MENIKPQYQEDGYEIKIEVGCPEQKSEMGGANKYYIYPIKGEDKHGNIEIMRRYSDFDNARNALVGRWPGCFIASLPQKKFIGNNESMFVQYRRRGLQQFLQIIKSIRHLWYSQQMQIFLRNNSSDFQKQLASIVSRTNPSELVSRYQINFKSFENVIVTSQMINKVLQFSLFLKQALPIIQNLINYSQTIHLTRKKYSQKYMTLLQFVLPQYQKVCVSQYLPQKNQDKLIFKKIQQTQFWHQQQKIKQNFLKNQTGMTCQGLKKQRRQVQSFLDTIKVRDDFQAAKQRAVGKVRQLQLENQKINSGKSSILSKIRNLSQQQQLKINQLQLEAAQKQQQQYTYICNMMNIILVCIEMEKFKKLRERSYYSLLKKVSLYEKQCDKSIHQLWGTILSHDSITQLKQE